VERVDSSQPRYPRDHAPGSSAIGTHFDVANWKTLAEASGFVRVEIPLLPWLKNPLGQLFGGFTPAFADILAARVVRSGGSIPKDSAIWYATTGMRVDYLEPIVNPTFEVECQLLRARGKSMLIEARFYQEQALAAFAVTTMLAIPR
jgi:acyl-coenzyme A thioesterase PaaI-like protein